MELTVTDVWPFTSVLTEEGKNNYSKLALKECLDLPLVNDEMTFAAKLHVAEGARVF